MKKLAGSETSSDSQPPSPFGRESQARAHLRSLTVSQSKTLVYTTTVNIAQNAPRNFSEENPIVENGQGSYDSGNASSVNDSAAQTYCTDALHSGATRPITTKCKQGLFQHVPDHLYQMITHDLYLVRKALSEKNEGPNFTDSLRRVEKDYPQLIFYQYFKSMKDPSAEPSQDLLDMIKTNKEKANLASIIVEKFPELKDLVRQKPYKDLFGALKDLERKVRGSSEKQHQGAKKARKQHRMYQRICIASAHHCKVVKAKIPFEPIEDFMIKHYLSILPRNKKGQLPYNKWELICALDNSSHGKHVFQKNMRAPSDLCDRYKIIKGTVIGIPSPRKQGPTQRTTAKKYSDQIEALFPDLQINVPPEVEKALEEFVKTPSSAVVIP